MMTLGTEHLFREHGHQVAALCWRRAPMLEILLITSRRTRRWIIPKGWPIAGLTLAAAAAREALEEAGVAGEIADDVIGQYHYLKEKKNGSAMPCRVEVFALEVKSQQNDWTEKGQRETAWLSPDQAIKRLSEPGLREILRDFARAHTARAARRA